MSELGVQGYSLPLSLLSFLVHITEKLAAVLFLEEEVPVIVMAH